MQFLQTPLADHGSRRQPTYNCKGALRHMSFQTYLEFFLDPGA